MDAPAPFRLTPWVRRLLAASVLVWLLGITVFTGPWYRDLLAFSPEGASNRPWTLLTYMFQHQGFVHLAFNLLVLSFFGPPVERRMGGPAFAMFYVFCGLGAPVLAYAMSLVTPVAPFAGASAAVFGVAAAFAVAWPEARVYIFPFPSAIPVAWLVAFLVALDVLPLAFGVEDGIAHFAHLGGLVFALLYLKAETVAQRPRHGRRDDGDQVQVLVAQHAEAQDATAEHVSGADLPALPPPRRPTADETAAEVNRVLDKISASGLKSLTPTERRFLDDASKKMRRS